MITRNSRYLLADVVQVTSPVTGALLQPAFMDLRQRVNTFASDDVFITLPTSSDWSHLALAALGAANHWWVIADLSNVIDPFVELPALQVAGSMLRSPSQHRFFFEILAPSQTTT